MAGRSLGPALIATERSPLPLAAARPRAGGLMRVGRGADGADAASGQLDTTAPAPYLTATSYGGGA